MPRAVRSSNSSLKVSRRRRSAWLIVMPTLRAARVMFRSAISASKMTNRLRSMLRRFMEATRFQHSAY
jgi:hypothetical protein